MYAALLRGAGEKPINGMAARHKCLVKYGSEQREAAEKWRAARLCEILLKFVPDARKACRNKTAWALNGKLEAGGKIAWLVR